MHTTVEAQTGNAVGLNNSGETGTDVIVASVYEAALEPARWPEALGRIASHISASSAFLFSSHSETEPDAFMHVHNHAPEMVQGFGSYWHTQDEWAMAARRKGYMRPGWVLGSQLVPREQFIKTPIFNEFCKPHGIESMVGGVLFDGSEPDGMPFTNVCWYRPQGAMEFQAAERERLEHLAPHLRRALRIQRKLRSLVDDRVDKTLGALRTASFVLDRKGRLHHHNQAAHAFLAGLPGGSMRSGRLCSIGANCWPSVPEALAACSAANPVRMVALLPGDQPQVISGTLMQLPSEGLLSVEDHGHERFLLLVDLPRTDGRGAAAAVAELFGLSSAEVRVLGSLLEGATPAEIAAAAGTGLSTVRSQIKSLFSKTNTNAQTELLLLMRGMRF